MSLRRHLMPNIFRHKAWRFISQISIELLLVPLKVMFSITPKRKKQWVIGHHHGFCDNAKLVAQEIAKTRPDITLIWLKSNPEHVVDSNIISCTKYSIRGVYYQITSKVFIVSTGLNDIGRMTPYFNCYYFNLWHGWPIKKIGLDSKETSPSKNKLISTLYNLLYTRSNQRYHAFFCHNLEQEKIFQEAFGISGEKTIVTGWPRLRKINSTKISQLTFAPTWHIDNKTTVKLIENVIQAFSRQSSLEYLSICLHPFDRELIEELNAEYNNENIRFSCGDTIENIEKSKLVISDFSSIIIDAAVSYDCDVILFYSDIDQYVRERGIYKEFLGLMNNHVDLNSSFNKYDIEIATSNRNCTKKIINHIDSFVND
ncbi:hypothetical protein CWO05_12160 [Vibrio splendidus]|nr:hypothetical protein CWO05_12160 [Vibrio splendidus]